MNRFYLLRSNLRTLEYYHNYKDIETFEKNCHDYWLLFPLELLKNDIVDEVIIWRLNPKQKQDDIIFDINGKKFIQKWVDNFEECLSYPKPIITFFRGGFAEYDILVNTNPKHLGLKLYTGTGKRILPQYGGKYDYYLMENNSDILTRNHIPFYKTASNNIFQPMIANYKYDIFWMANFEQYRFKGQEFFIKKISESKYLKTLKIIHLGNKPEMGKKLCKKYGIKNIEFLGWKKRPEVNKLICESKFGIVTSNNQDGCPRVITEMLCAGTPIIVRNTTRLLNWYNMGVIKFDDNNIEDVIKQALNNQQDHKKDLIHNLDKLSIKNIVMINWNIWKYLN